MTSFPESTSMDDPEYNPPLQPHDADSASTPLRPATAKQIRALRAQIAKLPLKGEPFFWLGARAREANRVDEVRAELPEGEIPRTSFDAGVATHASRVSRAYVNAAVSAAISRAISRLGAEEPTRTRPTRLDGLSIVGLDRAVADDRDAGLLSVTLQFRSLEVTLPGLDGCTLTKWASVYGAALERGVVLPNGRGASDEWKERLAAAGDVMKVKVVAPSETRPGRIRQAIVEFMAEVPAKTLPADLRSGAAVYVTVPGVEGERVAIVPHELCRRVRLKLPDEVDVTDMEVSAEAEHVGAIRTKVGIVEAADPVWALAFPASIRKQSMQQREGRPTDMQQTPLPASSESGGAVEASESQDDSLGDSEIPF